VRAAGQLPQELMKVSLEGFETFLEQQEHEHGESQHALATEVDRPAAMAPAKVRGQETLTKLFNDTEGAILERKEVLHPHGKSRM
jgi:hypothetical protein